MHSESLRVENLKALTGGLLEFGAEHNPNDARARLLRQIRAQSGRAGIGRGGAANDFSTTAILEAAIAEIGRLNARVEALEGGSGGAVSGGDPREAEPAEMGIEDLEGVGPSLAEALAAEGYTTLDELEQAGDEELLEVKGISENRLEQIRGQLAEIRAGVA